MVVGLTGGIGSGKSTIAKIFSTLGIPVFYSDNIASSVTETNEEVISQMKKLFGEDIYPSGKLNRKKIAETVFSNKEILNQLNLIIHPLVRLEFEKFKSKNQNALFIIKEAAILFESGASSECDKTITVNCEESIRIQRVIKRDQGSEADVVKRIKNQWTDLQRAERSNYIITNNNTEFTIPQVLKINEDIIRFAAQRS